MVEDLSRVRTAALQQEVAANQHVAFAVLLDALLPIVTDGGYPASHAVQLKGGSLQQTGGTFEVSTREIASPFEGVAELIEAMPRDAAARFDWLLALESRDVDGLLAACTAALIDASQGKFVDRARLQSADRIARAVGLDMTQHWEGGIGFYDRLTRKAALTALTEARGTDAAENCAKLKKPDLAAACNERIPGSGWLPSVLVTPSVLVSRADAREDASFEERSDMEDEEPMAIAAE